ncbi:MAG: type II toxin-antitoxin system RelE/ParE family toxin [Wenzhouxiangellaceae bacterium]|nr:type II toxin-antitoxin system RelE/ParE family toxin [Wenzhouxiangellaceae bacterium]
MAGYKLVFKRSVRKDLSCIPAKDVRLILQRIESLQHDPRPGNCEKLSAQERYRVRQGIYRIIYEVRDDVLVVSVVKVGHRGHVYRNA